MTQPLVIRADGDRQMGTGHVMRMFALAEAADAVAFVATRLDEALEERLRAVGAEVVRTAATAGTAEDARATVEVARSRGASRPARRAARSRRARHGGARRARAR